MSQTLKPGYKQTEVGVIPEEWALRGLGDVSDLDVGLSKPKIVFGSGCPVVTIQDLYAGSTINSSALKRVVVTEDEIQKYRLKKDDILIGNASVKRDGIGYSNRFDGSNEDVIFAKYAYRARTLRTIFPLFLHHTLRAQFCRQWIISNSQTGTLTNLNKTAARSIPIPVPPLPEQRAIATALSEVDALLSALDRLIAKQRDLKQAAMQQLLTGQTRLPGFGSRSASWHRSVFGVFPSDWTLQPLSQVSAFITKGSTPTTYGFQWVSSGVLFLRSECVSERGLDLSQSMFVSPQAHHMLKRSEVKAGDLLMTITGNVGRVVHLNEDFPPSNINQHIARIRMKDDHVAVAFVFHFLSQPLVRKYYNQITTGQAYPQISLTQVRDTILPLPPLPEQTAIATVLTDMDLELAALEQRRDKTRALKQGMMQELLTGRTRLV